MFICYIIHIIVVTQKWVHYLICLHLPEGTVCSWASADISGNARVSVLQLICYTSGTLKICPNLYSVPQHSFYIALYIVYIVVGNNNKCNSIGYPDYRHMQKNINFISRILYCKLDGRI